MTNVKVICDKCSKEFEIPLKRYNLKIKRNEKFYCSKECLKVKGSFLCSCAYCGREVQKQGAELKKSKSGNIFCSKSCAVSFNNSIYKTGENHPQYKNGLSSYRARAFISYKHECAICGWKDDERILEVHHISNSHNNNSLDNLIILCPTCHKKLTLDLYELIDKKELRIKKELL